MTKREVIENLELHPLEIEGGFFREVYRSRTPVEITAPDGEKNAYAASTSIYYLLGCGDVSSMHSIKFDETWHFYASSDTGIFVDLIVVSPAGTGRRVKLGARLELGQVPQFTVPAGPWMGARIDSAEGAGHLENNGAWALCGATVAPSFEYSDFIKGNAFEIAKLCPEFAAEILKLK